MIKNRVITISREFGSGGEIIGRRVAEELGIPCYDNDLIRKAAEATGFHEDYVREAGEYAQGGLLGTALSCRGAAPNAEDYLWKIQYQIITHLAEEGPCVIVGRCADYILRDKADCLRVFLHADLKFRAECAVRESGQVRSERWLKERDKRRAAYCRFYADMRWGRAHNYDLTLNTGTLGIETCTALIRSLY